MIPPLVNYESPRKELKLSELGFILNKEPIKIEDEKTITIGINTFGFGGTNAHIVLQEYKDENNKVQEFKQVIPNYNKKELWVPLDNYLEKFSNINKNFRKNENLTNDYLYLPTFEKEDILKTIEDNNPVYIISSYEKQTFVHKLNRFFRSKDIKSKLNFD
ncbi:MAG: ketoacyl-synthetase C-terminal extension domain-containing protein, partial [Candidatus Sericytochromatia bacterium]